MSEKDLSTQFMVAHRAANPPPKFAASPLSALYLSAENMGKGGGIPRFMPETVRPVVTGGEIPIT